MSDWTKLLALSVLLFVCVDLSKSEERTNLRTIFDLLVNVGKGYYSETNGKFNKSNVLLSIT